MSNISLFFLLVPTSLWFWPEAAGAQQQRVCDLESSQEINSAGLPGARVSYLSTPFFSCTDGTEIKADSSITYESTGLTRLIGNVRFREGLQELNSAEAEYYSSLGILEARGNVEVEETSRGTFIVGTELLLVQEYQETLEDIMTIRGLPASAILTPISPSSSFSTSTDNQAVPSSHIYADVLYLIGDRLLQAVGHVRVERDSLELYGDSLEFLQDGSSTKLFSNTKISHRDDLSGKTTTVKGDSVNILFSDGDLELIQSMGQSEAVYDNGRIYGSMVEMFFQDGELNRIHSKRDLALSPTQELDSLQATAVISDFTITGESIELELSGGKLLSATAIGAARGVSSSISNVAVNQQFPFVEEDWIEGDSLVILFSEPKLIGSPGPDRVYEEEDPVIEQMTAYGNARSFFRKPPSQVVTSDSIRGPLPELNYVRGDEVRIFLADGEIRQMEVDNAKGSFLQPISKPDTVTVSKFKIEPRYKEDH